MRILHVLHTLIYIYTSTPASTVGPLYKGTHWDQLICPLFRGGKCISTIGKSIFGALESVLCREVVYLTSYTHHKHTHTQYKLIPQSCLCIRRLSQEQKCYSVGRYCVDVKSFESVAIPTLDFKKLKSESKPASYQVIVVDEIGKMELFSRTFIDQV